MIYDIIVDLIKHLSISLSFLKPYATLLGVIVLLLRQNNIKKIINGKLPKRFRDTQSNDIYDIMKDIKAIKEHLGVVGEWESNGQQNGLKLHPLSFSKLSIYLHKVIPLGSQLRRKKMLTNLFKTSVSKKLTALLIGAAVTTLNKKLGLDVTPDELLAFLIVVGSYIVGQSHVDGKKAQATAGTTVTAGGSDNIAWQPMTFKDGRPLLVSVRNDINDLLTNATYPDKLQETLQTFTQVKAVIDSRKPAEPLPEVAERQETA